MRRRYNPLGSFSWQSASCPGIDLSDTLRTRPGGIRLAILRLIQGTEWTFHDDIS